MACGVSFAQKRIDRTVRRIPEPDTGTEKQRMNRRNMRLQHVGRYRLPYDRDHRCLKAISGEAFPLTKQRIRMVLSIF